MNEQQISKRQVGAARRMLNSLAGRHYSDTSIDPLLELLTKNEGIVLVASLQHVLKIRSVLCSEATYHILIPLLNSVGADISLKSAPPRSMADSPF